MVKRARWPPGDTMVSGAPVALELDVEGEEGVVVQVQVRAVLVLLHVALVQQMRQVRWVVSTVSESAVRQHAPMDILSAQCLQERMAEVVK